MYEHQVFVALNRVNLYSKFQSFKTLLHNMKTFYRIYALDYPFAAAMHVILIMIVSRN